MRSPDSWIVIEKLRGVPMKPQLSPVQASVRPVPAHVPASAGIPAAPGVRRSRCSVADGITPTSLRASLVLRLAV